MAQVSKIDSNQTELRFAEEASVGVLPATPVWNALDPNSYSDFGGEITTVARNPINSSRQRKKGVVVDLDASGGIEIDFTQDNMQSLMQGFLFADMRRSVELAATSVNGTTNAYVPTSGGAAYFANNLLFAKGYVLTANDGLKVVSGTPTGTSVTVSDTALVDEAGALSAVISRVGHEFGAGVAQVDASGPLPKLTISGVVAASQTLTMSDVFVNGDTVTIGSKVYTLQSALTDVDGHVKIGADTAATLINLRNAVNRNGLGVPGTDYALSTTADPLVTATATSTTLVVTARVAGVTGNSIATTEVATNGAWGAATLAGGTGHSFKEFGFFPGMWVCVGDDGANQAFATNVENNGLKRIRVIEDAALTFDKSTLEMATDNGAGKTIRLIWGRVNKNEVGPLVKRRSYQLERALGAPDDSALDQVQGEYLTGSIPNEFEFDMKQGDKLTCKLSFMSRDHETRTAAEGLKDGDRPTLQDADAFNATSHVARLSLAVIDPASATPVDLFAYLLDLNLKVNNNIKANKAIKVLGAFDNTAGTFEVSAETTAYFATVEATRAVRNNSDCTVDWTIAQANKGVTFDLPLLSLGGGRADVKQDEAVMLPITADAATAAKLDVNMNYTMLVQFWDYLPDLAA